MGFFDFFKKKDINEGLRAYRAEARAILIDVREQKEYAEGHLPHSRNIPLGRIDLVESMIPEKGIKTKSLQSQGSASQMRKNMPWLNQKKIPRI